MGVARAWAAGGGGRGDRRVECGGPETLHPALPMDHGTVQLAGEPD